MINHAIAAALLLSQASTPTGRPCVTPQEAGDMAVVMLPYLVDAAAAHCRPHVAGDAFLATGASAWSERLRRDGAPRRASALAGIGKIGGAHVPQGEGGEAAFQFFAQMMSLAMSSSIRPESCGQVDAIARSLEPLPTENIATLVGATLAFAMANATREVDDADAAADADADADGDPEDADVEAPEGNRGGPPICPA